MTHRTTVAVVGGGLAGMTAATVAALSGANVRLFEQSRAPGGRAITIERDGVLLNVGPHALYRHGAAARILESLGVTWSGHRPQVGGYAIVGGRRRRLPSGAISLATSGALSARGKVELGRIYAALGGLDPAPLQSVPLEAWLKDEIHDTGARKAFAALTRVTTYGNAPAIASAGAAIQQFQLGRGGVLYLDDGWQTLVDGLRNLAVQAGVTIETGVRIDSLRQCGDLWQVGAGAVGHFFDAVVLAVPPGVAAGLLDGSARDTLRGWADGATPIRAAVLDVVLSQLPNPRGVFALGFDEPTYLSAHSVTARLAPEGQTLITAAWYRDPWDTLETGAIERRLESTLDLAQPGWREFVTFRRLMPDLIVANDYVRCATDGYKGRPGPAVPCAAGLFIAGDWVGAEGMLADAAVASGQSAGQLAAAPARVMGGTVSAAQ